MTNGPDEETWRKKLARPASIAKLGGRPSDDPLASWFGKVLVGKADETWPSFRGTPLVPILQANLKELPFCPPSLSDLAFLTFYVTEEFAYIEEQSSRTPSKNSKLGWCVRTFERLEELVPIDSPTLGWPVRPMPISFKIAEADFPTHDLLPEEMPDSVADPYYDLPWYANADATKFGGWPSCVQSEPYWDYTPGIGEFEFAFQIASEPKAAWRWGDEGIAYLARHRTDLDRWAFDWQCY